MPLFAPATPEKVPKDSKARSLLIDRYGETRREVKRSDYVHVTPHIARRAMLHRQQVTQTIHSARSAADQAIRGLLTL